MFKKDGKDFYSFTGLINRMETCKLHSGRLSEKDIPEEVKFRDRVYKLDEDRKYYYDPDTGVPLAEVVGEVYGDNMYKYLTEHEFIAIHKEKMFLTSEEREFLRMCNLFLGHDNATLSFITRLDQYRGKDDVLLGLYFSSDSKTTDYEEWVSIVPTTFLGLEDARMYSLRDLKIYE